METMEVATASNNFWETFWFAEVYLVTSKVNCWFRFSGSRSKLNFRNLYFLRKDWEAVRPHKITSDQPSLHGHPRLDLELWFETDLQKEKWIRFFVYLSGFPGVVCYLGGTCRQCLRHEWRRAVGSGSAWAAPPTRRPGASRAEPCAGTTRGYSINSTREQSNNTSREHKKYAMHVKCSKNKMAC